MDQKYSLTALSKDLECPQFFDPIMVTKQLMHVEAATATLTNNTPVTFEGKAEQFLGMDI
jgi:hypothetical protein